MSLPVSLVIRRLLLANVTLAGALLAQAPAPHAMALRDWYRVTTVSQPAVSPDGKRVAFTVTTVRESENKRHQEVWVAPDRRWRSAALDLAGIRKQCAALDTRRYTSALHVDAAAGERDNVGDSRRWRWR